MPSSRSIVRWRALVSALAALSLATGALLASGAPSFASTPPTYTISGHVSEDQTGGSPIPATDVSAELFSMTGNATANIPPKSIGVENGAFTLTGVAPGRYRLFFQGDTAPSLVPAVGASWFGSYYEDESTAIVVTDQDITGLSQVLPVAATIGGTVSVTSGPAVSTLDLNATAYLYDPTTGTYDQQNFAATTVNGDGTYTIPGLAPGQWLVRVASVPGWDPAKLVSPGYFPATNLTTATEGQTITGADVSVGFLGSYEVGTDRLAGADRYKTSVQVSQAFFPSSPPSPTLPSGVVFVASGQNYPDALSASAAAGTYDSPLLLVEENSVPTEVTTEIRRLAPTYIVVVGGTGAVSTAVYTQLSELVPSSADIARESGADRYATSRAVAAFAFEGKNTQSHLDAVFIATGADYPDALVAGGAAGYDYSPVLLVNGSATSLDSATTALLKTLDPGRIYIVGGDAVVSAGIQSQLDASTSAPVLRLSGEDRYGTAEAVDNEVFPFADYGYFATGDGYADALSISADSGANGSPLYLTEPSCIPQETWAGATNEQGVFAFFTVGGTGVISNAVAQGLEVCGESASAAQLGTTQLPTRPHAQAVAPRGATGRPARPKLHF